MTIPRPELAKVLAAGRRLAPPLAVLLIVGFVIAFGARPATVLSSATVDDALFMQLGMNLASGQWLGPYNELTLVKGAGFPIFLAIANLSGLPYPLALASFHAACASFAGLVFLRLTRSRAVGLAVLAALLLAPTLYDGDLLRVFRDTFYMSLTIAFASAVVALATGSIKRPRTMAALTGCLGAWIWLTREEGVWLVPLLGCLLLIPLLAARRIASTAPLTARLAPLQPAGLALGVALALTTGFGLVNWAVYGRFEINEIKASPFQSALTALQDASWPFHKKGVPVPAAARARIYAVSPAFASLKEPYLDGHLQTEASQWGCLENPTFCHELGGGWFLWYLRSSASARGQHETPAKAAAFYRTVAREVRAACKDGRLECRHWPVPLVPPMTAGEIGDVQRSFGQVLNIVTFGGPGRSAPSPSDLTSPSADAFINFLNLPEAAGAVSHRRLQGWYSVDGDAWFQVQAAEPIKVRTVQRDASPDLVSAFKDPRLTNQRFALTVDCPSTLACPVTIVPDGGGAPVTLDLSTPVQGPHPVAGGTLHIDVGGSNDKDLFKTRLSRAWLALEGHLAPLFRALVIMGILAYAARLALALIRREVSVGLAVCTGLIGSVFARMMILALIDALSFRAATQAYSLPGIALLLMFSVLALHELAAALLSGRHEARKATT